MSSEVGIGQASADENTPLIADGVNEVGSQNVSTSSDERRKKSAPSTNGSNRGGLTLTKASVRKVTRKIRISMLQHSLSASHYDSRQFYFFTVPQAFLGLAASYFALATENSKMAGILSAFSVLLQTIEENCEYGESAVMHRTVSIGLGNLREEMGFLKEKIRLKEDLGVRGDSETLSSNGTGSDQEQKRKQKDDFDTINDRINHLLDLCKSKVPMPIEDAFLAVESELKLSRAQAWIIREFKEIKKGDVRDLTRAELNYVNYVETKAFDLINTEICNYFLFPLFLPKSRYVAESVSNRLSERCLSDKRPTYYEPIHELHSGDKAESV